jgi:hypothetical protein
VISSIPIFWFGFGSGLLYAESGAIAIEYANINKEIDIIKNKEKMIRSHY